MRELVRTNDAVLITAIEALLNGADIKHLVVDQQYERAGRLDRHFPAPHSGRRGRVRCGARSLLEEAGFAHELRPDGR